MILTELEAKLYPPQILLHDDNKDKAVFSTLVQQTYNEKQAESEFLDNYIDLCSKCYRKLIFSTS